jgi:hypothetical protein
MVIWTLICLTAPLTEGAYICGCLAAGLYCAIAAIERKQVGTTIKCNSIELNGTLKENNDKE